MTVLSLFDGISCGRYILDKLGINHMTYYASEINPYATSISNNNHPDIIRLGDVTKWREWDIDWSSIKLVIGGSPCQGFSSAGKQGGTKATVNGVEVIVSDRETYHAVKKAGGVFLSQSHLFWEYVLILDHVKAHNPRVAFMLENVKMSKNNLDMITSALGVAPVFINSAVLSAQNRQRYYWCNWFVPEPQDRGLLIADILEHDVSSEYDHTDKALAYMNRVGTTGRVKWSYGLHSEVDKGKSACVASNFHKGVPNNLLVVKRVNDNARVKAITEDSRGFRPHQGDVRSSGISELGRICKPSGKTDCMLTNHMPKVAINSDVNDLHYRKFTPIECERLQGLPDNYTSGVSDTQRYIAIGNGWQCDTVEHVLFWLFIFGVNRHENTPN